MKGYGYVMDYSMKMVKEIYKSQVYCVKNKTFINFALEKRRYSNYKGKMQLFAKYWLRGDCPWIDNLS